MGKNPVTYRTETDNNQLVNASLGKNTTIMDENQNNPVFDSLAAEGGENFFHYINWLGLAKDPNLMVLSSIHHY